MIRGGAVAHLRHLFAVNGLAGELAEGAIWHQTARSPPGAPFVFSSLLILSFPFALCACTLFSVGGKPRASNQYVWRGCVAGNPDTLRGPWSAPAPCLLGSVSESAEPF
jgi:hypothetical protein